MRSLILATASVLALGMGSAGAATWHHHSGSAMRPHAGKTAYSRTYSKAFSKHRLSARNTKGRLTSHKVKEAQEALRRDHLYRGPIDGVSGPLTRHALAKFQKENGLRVTASLDRSTLSSLRRGGTVGYGSSQKHPNMSAGQGGNSGQTPGQMPGQTPMATGNSGQNMGTGSGASGNMNTGANTGTNPGATTK